MAPKAHEVVHDEHGRDVTRRKVGGYVRGKTGSAPSDVAPVFRTVGFGKKCVQKLQAGHGQAQYATGLQYAVGLGQHVAPAGVAQVLE